MPSAGEKHGKDGENSPKVGIMLCRDKNFAQKRNFCAVRCASNAEK